MLSAFINNAFAQKYLHWPQSQNIPRAFGLMFTEISPILTKCNSILIQIKFSLHPIMLFT